MYYEYYNKKCQWRNMYIDLQFVLSIDCGLNKYNNNIKTNWLFFLCIILHFYRINLFTINHFQFFFLAIRIISGYLDGGVAVVSQFVVGYYMKGQIVDLYTYSFIDIFCVLIQPAINLQLTFQWTFNKIKCRKNFLVFSAIFSHIKHIIFINIIKLLFFLVTSS
jgi:hypothetical protein